MDATTAKRKRRATDIDGDSSASTAAAAIEEVSDAEVEEFYAILRRMRNATRRLCGAGARPPARVPAWRPSFSWEDFAAAPPAAPVPAPAQPDEERIPKDDVAAPATAAVPSRVGLDLNVEPEPETPAPATPRSARAQA